MDTFENNEFQENGPVSEHFQEQQPGAYRAAGTGRRESPYANSPYEMNRPPQESYSYSPQKPKKPRREGASLGRRVVSVLLTIALVAGSCGLTAFLVNRHWEQQNRQTTDKLWQKIRELESELSTVTGTPAGTLPVGMEYTPGAVYNNCVNSVVAISSTVETGGYYGGTSTGSGSGFVLSADGYIATNYHVVEGATSISVIVHDGTEYPAELVGYDDSANDLAVLKIEAEGLQAATIGSSSDLAIGDMVVAIGNPLGELTSTQTVGYVSGIGREVATGSLTTISMIQTDAAINPGNSGGPLFNMRGEVIGITTAKYSGTTGSGASIEGIGFAIPIDDVMNVVDDLIDFGYVTGAYMGVSVQNTDEASAEMFGLPTGAYIYTVEKGGAADRAGIQPKDIVIQIGEYKVSNVTDLTRALRNFKAGDTTTVTLIRSGAQKTLEITLDEKPQTTSDPTESQAMPQQPNEGSYDEWFDYFRRYFGG